jgi:hypothetical protein
MVPRGVLRRIVMLLLALAAVASASAATDPDGALRPAAVDPAAGFSAGSPFTKKLIGSTPPIPIGSNG